MTFDDLFAFAANLITALNVPMKCRKCGMRSGGGFCDRQLLGEVGACEMVPDSKAGGQ